MIIALISFLCLAVDQLSKYWIANHYQNVSQEPIVILRNVLDFTYTENRGAAFGLLDGAKWFFIVITLLACGALIFWLTRLKMRRHWTLTLSSALILGGAIGNLVDRVWLGYVRDFIHVNIPFAIFNFADCCVVVGGILFGIYLLFLHERLQAKQKNAAGEETRNETADL